MYQKRLTAVMGCPELKCYVLVVTPILGMYFRMALDLKDYAIVLILLLWTLRKGHSEVKILTMGELRRADKG
tara:strand:+ start:40 stop:255 length:216 start_codon:yes stop_codon:yes gene_type:complete